MKLCTDLLFELILKFSFKKNNNNETRKFQAGAAVLPNSKL